MGGGQKQLELKRCVPRKAALPNDGNYTGVISDQVWNPTVNSMTAVCNPNAGNFDIDGVALCRRWHTGSFAFLSYEAIRLSTALCDDAPADDESKH